MDLKLEVEMACSALCREPVAGGVVERGGVPTAPFVTSGSLELRHTERALRDRVRVWLCALIVAAGVVVAVTPAPASARYDQSYCGYLVQSGQTCGSGSYHSYIFNYVSFGLSLPQVCAGLLTEAGNWKARSSGWPDGCASNTSAYGVCFANPTPYSQGVVWGFWSGGAYHTINGLAATSSYAYWCP